MRDAGGSLQCMLEAAVVVAVVVVVEVEEEKVEVEEVGMAGVAGREQQQQHLLLLLPLPDNDHMEVGKSVGGEVDAKPALVGRKRKRHYTGEKGEGEGGLTEEQEVLRKFLEETALVVEAPLALILLLMSLFQLQQVFRLPLNRFYSRPGADLVFHLSVRDPL